MHTMNDRRNPAAPATRVKPSAFHPSQCVLLVWLAGALCGAPGVLAQGKKAAKLDPSDAFFTNGTIPHLVIEITGTNLAQLQKENRKSVRATVREGDTVYPDVAIHLKGAAGSFRGLDEKPALTLNFDKFVDGQNFHGLDKLHLNNSVQDPSYLTELICGELFVAAGVPAARTTHARVTLNGRDRGFYVLKEGFDKKFLRRHFKSAKGTLYDGGFLQDIDQALEVDEGEKNHHAPLKALVAACQEADRSRRLERMRALLDLDRFVTFIALDIMMWDWDGYPMNRNNYRVYHRPESNQIVFLPHGMDQMFWAPDGPVMPGMNGLVARALLDTEEGRELYLARVGQLLTNVFRVEAITNRVRQVQARVRPALAAIDGNAARDHDGQVQRLCDLIVQRARHLERQLQSPGLRPLKFDATGVIRLTGWEPQTFAGNSALEEVQDQATAALRIRAKDGERCVASWRTRAQLEAGDYRFEARVRTAAVAALRDEVHQGAGLRISGDQQRRPGWATGDSEWKTMQYEFHLPERREVVFVCELRASRGEAWFAVDSLRLVRQSK